ALQSMTTREIKHAAKNAVLAFIRNPESMNNYAGGRHGEYAERNVDENCVRMNALVGQVAMSESSLYDLAREMESSRFPAEVLSAWEDRYPWSEPLQGIKVVIEGAHTPSGLIAAGVFQKLGAVVVLINGDVKEIVGMHKADPSQDENLEELRKVIEQEKADFGLAFDLDGDRGAIVIPGRHMGQGVRFFTLAPDNLIVAMLPYILDHTGYRESITGRKVGVIRDVLGTFAVNDMSKRLGVDIFQTDAGYVYLKEKRSSLLDQNYCVPIYGERSGHCWLDVTGEIENPIAVAVILAVIVKKNKYTADNTTHSINPFLETYDENTIPYLQSPRFQPPFHPVLLSLLSDECGAEAEWDFATGAVPPQMVIARGKDRVIKELAEEFSIGKVFDTASGPLRVQAVQRYRDQEEDGGLFRFADIVFELLDGTFAGRFVFRASSNDPTFVCSYETPLLAREDRSSSSYIDRRISIGALVLQWLEDNGRAMIRRTDIQERLGLNDEQYIAKAKLWNLPAVQSDMEIGVARLNGHADPLTYPLQVPTTFIAAGYVVDAVMPVANGLVAGASQRVLEQESSVLRRQLEALRQLLGCALPQQEYAVIITQDSSRMYGMVAACDIDNATVYLHPYFFVLPEAKQLEILYHEFISHIYKGIREETVAFADTHVWAVAQNLQQVGGGEGNSVDEAGLLNADTRIRELDNLLPEKRDNFIHEPVGCGLEEGNMYSRRLRELIAYLEDNEDSQLVERILAHYNESDLSVSRQMLPDDLQRALFYLKRTYLVSRQYGVSGEHTVSYVSEISNIRVLPWSEFEDRINLVTPLSGLASSVSYLFPDLDYSDAGAVSCAFELLEDCEYEEMRQKFEAFVIQVSTILQHIQMGYVSLFILKDNAEELLTEMMQFLTAHFETFSLIDEKLVAFSPENRDARTLQQVLAALEGLPELCARLQDRYRSFGACAFVSNMIGVVISRDIRFVNGLYSHMVSLMDKPAVPLTIEIPTLEPEDVIDPCHERLEVIVGRRMLQFHNPDVINEVIPVITALAEIHVEGVQAEEARNALIDRKREILSSLQGDAREFIFDLRINIEQEIMRRELGLEINLLGDEFYQIAAEVIGFIQDVAQRYANGEDFDTDIFPCAEGQNNTYPLAVPQEAQERAAQQFGANT
ncbi:MAG TPA: hypothetical protein PKL77_07145, partial [Candidatus Omnitrophota bacterium]|nr:hypothetical protein [Candidatus Omnitrophota bacterium]